MQRAREIARLRTTLVGAEQPDDIPAEESRRSRYRTRSSSRTKSGCASPETRPRSRNRQYSSTDDDEDERPYDRAYMRKSRSRLRSRSRGKSRPKFYGSGDQKSPKVLGAQASQVKYEEKEGMADDSEGDNFDECTFDAFCWVCHRTIDFAELGCVTCERRFHPDCVGRGGTKPLAWSCPECALELASDQAENRSWAMQQISVTQLGTLLKFAVKEMQQRVKSSEIFAAPVSLKTHPSYRHFVLRPTDLSVLNARVDSLSYGSTAGFLADAKYILHNSVVFNGSSSGVTRIARRMLGICASQMDEIETCPECYLRAHTQEDWFTGVCASPHLLVWAKSGRYPFWPAKIVKICGNEIDCRFFGAHEKALIPSSLVFLFSSHPPTGPLRSSGQLAEAIEECQTYISNLQKRHGLFCLAPNRTLLDVEKMADHLAMQLPNLPAQQDSKAKKDTTVIIKEQKLDPRPAGTSSRRPENQPSPHKEERKELPGDSGMSDLQRLDALHRDFLEAEPPMVDTDDSSNEDAVSWHPNSPLSGKNTAASPLTSSGSPVVSPVPARRASAPAVSPLAAKQAPNSAASDELIASPSNAKGPLSPAACRTGKSLLTAAPTDAKSPLIRTVDIKTLMPEPTVSTPPRPVAGQSLLIQRVVNQSIADPKYMLVSPTSTSQPKDTMILVATSSANQFVAVSSAGSGVKYALCQPISEVNTSGQAPNTRQVALATPGNKYISVVPAMNKKPVQPVVAVQPKPVAITTMQTVKTIAPKPVPPAVPVITTVQTVKLVAENPVATTKPVLVQSVKALGASSVAAAKPVVATSAQTVLLISANSATAREVIAVTAVSNTKTISVLSNSQTVSSVPFAKNISAVSTTGLMSITVSPVQTVKAIGSGVTIVPNLVSSVTTTTVSRLDPVVSAKASPSPVTSVPSQPPNKETERGTSASGTKAEAEIVLSPVTKLPSAVIPKNVENEVVSRADVFTLDPVSQAPGEISKKAGTGDISIETRGEILTLVPMNAPSGEIPKKDATDKTKMEVLALVPMKAATTELPKTNVPVKVYKKPAASVLSSRKTIVPIPSEEMPEFETVFLQESMDTDAATPNNVAVYSTKKTVPSAASNGLPKMMYLSSKSQPETTLKRSLTSNKVGELTVVTQAEFERNRKRGRFEFDPSRPLTLVEHPPPGIKATPLPLGASPQAASRASPIARPMPTANLRKIVAAPSPAAPTVAKTNLTARKSIIGAGVTIAYRPKETPSTAETLEPAPKASVSTEPSPVEKSLAELGAKAFADFYERFLDTAANDGHLEAKLKKKQLELERVRWRMQEQINEQRSSFLLLLNERAASFRSQLNAQSAEVTRIHRVLDDLKKDFKKHLADAKKKQWCAACLREAKFHCCWNTSYCAKPCQLSHWAKHNTVCKNRQVRRNSRVSHPVKITQPIPKEVVLEEGELDPEAAAARKVALDNAARVIESVANPDTTNADTESQHSIDLPDRSQTSIVISSQSLATSDLPNQSQIFDDLDDQAEPAMDFTDHTESSTDSLKQTQPFAEGRDPSQSGAESDSSDEENPGLYMECVAEENNSNDGNQSATSLLGSVRVVSVRSLGGDNSLWKQKALERH